MQISLSKQGPHQILLQSEPEAIVGALVVLAKILQYPLQGVSAHQQRPNADPHAVDVCSSLMVGGCTHPPVRWGGAPCGQGASITALGACNQGNARGTA